MIETANQLVAACMDAVHNHKTMYVLSCFGAPMNEKNKERYAKADPARAAQIRVASEDTFGFDCICFIKGLMWGWNGNKDHVYGGAEYKSNGIPDIGADSLIKQCLDVSEDFSTIVPGEYVWLPGHCGIYVGDGLAAEATFEPKSGVQLQAVLPMGVKDGYPATGWKKHGKLPWIRYESEPEKLYKVTLEGVRESQRKELETLAEAYGWGICAEATQVETPVAPAWEPAVGEIVRFGGGLQYSSANGETGTQRPAGLAKLTKTAPGKRHPYHLIKTGTQGPYGWVDRDTITKE